MTACYNLNYTNVVQKPSSENTLETYAYAYTGG